MPVLNKICRGCGATFRWTTGNRGRQGEYCPHPLIESPCQVNSQPLVKLSTKWLPYIKKKAKPEAIIKHIATLEEIIEELVKLLPPEMQANKLK